MQAKGLSSANTTKREIIFQRSAKAGQLEVLMLMVSAIAVIGAVFAFLNYGWLPCLALLILGAIAFGVSQLFDLIVDLFSSIEEQGRKRQSPE